LSAEPVPPQKILLIFAFVCLQIQLQVKWELKNENGNDIVCALIPVKIMWQQDQQWSEVLPDRTELQWSEKDMTLNSLLSIHWWKTYFCDSKTVFHRS